MNSATFPGRRFRIGLVVPSLELGGGVPSVAEFVCQTIERSGLFDIALFSLSASARDGLGVALTRPATWFRGVGKTEGIWRGRPFTRVGAAGSEFEFRRYQPRRVLTEALADCDLIQVVCGSPASAYAVCGLGKPVAVHCATRAAVERRSRQAQANGVAEVWRRWMTRITDKLDRKALQSVDAIQVMNPWMLEYASRLTTRPDAIVSLVQPGVDALRFQPASHRDLLTDPYILCVGRLDDVRKNLDLLVEAYSLISEAQKRRVRLVLAGLVPPSGEFWDRVRRQGLSDRITFVDSPSRDELVALYRSASVFALPSHEEGFGMVVLEAMSCGIPVVSTRSGGPDAIIQDGRDGFLVPLDDATAFADRLSRLLSDEALNREMGSAARHTIVDRYDMHLAGDVLLRIYHRLLGNPLEYR
jgi:glycosyltransferase involved in cell wall biosynthesis